MMPSIVDQQLPGATGSGLHFHSHPSAEGRLHGGGGQMLTHLPTTIAGIVCVSIVLAGFILLLTIFWIVVSCCESQRRSQRRQRLGHSPSSVTCSCDDAILPGSSSGPSVGGRSDCKFVESKKVLTSSVSGGGCNNGEAKLYHQHHHPPHRNHHHHVMMTSRRHQQQQQVKRHHSGNSSTMALTRGGYFSCCSMTSSCHHRSGGVHKKRKTKKSSRHNQMSTSSTSSTLQRWSGRTPKECLGSQLTIACTCGRHFDAHSGQSMPRARWDSDQYIRTLAKNKDGGRGGKIANVLAVKDMSVEVSNWSTGGGQQKRGGEENDDNVMYILPQIPRPPPLPRT